MWWHIWVFQKCQSLVGYMVVDLKKNIFMPKLNPNIAFDPIALGPFASITSSEDCMALFQGKKGGLFCQSRVRLPRVCQSLPVV